MHWAKRARYNEAWAWRIRAAMGWPAVFDQAPDKARVTITQYRRKLLDVDNLYSACKPILDGLEDWRLIEDDSPDHIELTVRQEKAKDTHTEIEIQAQEKCLTHTADKW
jgi:Holliday junction resolvase RusA-like endonuclease